MFESRIQDEDFRFTPRYVALDELLDLSVLRFLHLQSADNKRTFFTRLLGGLGVCVEALVLTYAHILSLSLTHTYRECYLPLSLSSPSKLRSQLSLVFKSPLCTSFARGTEKVHFASLV